MLARRSRRARGARVGIGNGYNTTESGALASYREFVANFEVLGPQARGMVEDIVAFRWPGDARLGWFSFASYPTEIRPAREAAGRLATYLQAVRGPGGTPVQVVLIAHSLGNRVAMELLQAFAATRSATSIERCCLMAAAVPVPVLESGGALVRGATVSRTQVLHSASDPVLRWAFPPGETLAREGSFPEAVGRAGAGFQNHGTRDLQNHCPPVPHRVTGGTLLTQPPFVQIRAWA